jgi:DNA (cytosine-5)-methyltransferase 1
MGESSKVFNVLDLFCGTGAITYGMSQFDSRFRVEAGIDIDRAACGTASANHPHARILCSSILKVTPKDFERATKLTRVDMIVGGPPCQGFSSLRPHRQSNVDDPRNQLFRQFISYVKYFEPKTLLMENVVGILGGSNGKVVQEILEGFRKIGYAVDWRVLNAANYGVPQKRERFVLAGVRLNGRRCVSISFPKPTHHFSGRVIGTRLKSNYIFNESDGAAAVTVIDAISDLPRLDSGEERDCYRSPPKNSYQQARRRGCGNKVSLHIAANHSQKMVDVMKVAGGSKLDLPPGLVTSGFSSCYSRMEPNEPATTITVKFTSPASSKCIHPTQNRAITPREAARLQGFDDAFVFYGSKTEIASQLGNAVPPLLGAALAPIFVEHLG